MNRETGFLDFRRKDAGYRPVEERVRDYKAVERRLTDEEIRRQTARCMDCGIPFCHGCGCPLANVIPEFNGLVYDHRWEDALDLLLSTNCFPEFAGRICPAPCETSCVLGINDEPVTIRQVELAIIEKGFERGYMDPRPPARRPGKRVAVVGAGPAGMAVADMLNREGVDVVVYDSAARPGGILRYGIPDFKLEKWVVDRRVRLMEAEGVRFEPGVEIGRDISHRYLKDRFDAVVLTGGAREPRDLKVPGRELGGIHHAMPYLVQQNMRLGGEPVDPAQEITAADRAVVVLGGGDTGSDCIGTAIRQGARSVRQFEILPRPPAARSPATPWPQWPDMLRESSSHQEGGERRWGVATKAFAGEGGRVRQLRCVEVEWERPASGGAPAPREKPGTEFSVEADLVLLALGFVGPGRNLLVEKLGIKLDGRGFVQRDGNCMTSDPGTFVAGDMTRGASLVVRAIADGQTCARGVLRYLGLGD
jgi:glutamate synthase (NADPH) small chain